MPQGGNKTKAQLIEELNQLRQHISELKTDTSEPKMRTDGLQELLDAYPDTTVIVDERGRIVVTDTQTEQLFGYGPEELVGQPRQVMMSQPHPLP